MVDETAPTVEMVDEAAPNEPPTNGVRIHRDTVMAWMLGLSIVSLLGLGVLSAYQPPNNWNVFNRVVDILSVTVSNILVGHFALSQRP